QHQPFVPLNCAALSPQLIESELFGHERGAFTGAVQRQQGAFSRADGGTLFLDEIGELGLGMQARLLRVLENGEVRRIGCMQPHRVQVRVVAATNRCLRTEVAAGRFRLDLFHRLHVLALRLPPLRQRPDDIVPLAHHLLQRDAGAAPTLGEAAAQKLMAYSWPGNVRELRHVLQRAALFCEAGQLGAQDITFAEAGFDDGAEAAPPGGMLRRMERDAILAALAACDGNRTRAAGQLGLSRATLHRRLHSLGGAPDGRQTEGL
ncbi:MAG: sigma-54-dependent Fis family transcriptional regulator, partial [Oxalobacteraceae bacterium]